MKLSVKTHDVEVKTVMQLICHAVKAVLLSAKLNCYGNLALKQGCNIALLLLVQIWIKSKFLVFWSSFLFVEKTTVYEFPIK